MEAKEGTQSGRTPGAGVLVVNGLALTVAAITVVLTAGTTRWSPLPLVMILVFAIASDLTSVDAGMIKLKISGSFLATMLAAVLFGAGAGAIVGAATVLCGRLRWREPFHYTLDNLATYAWFPLGSGLFFHATVGLAHSNPHAVSYYLLVLVTFVVALGLNFVGIVGYRCYLERSSLVHKVHDILLPVLSAELFSALLMMAAVFVAVEMGTTGLALFVVVLAIFQYLVGELLKSKHRGEKLDRIATTDELTGLPNRERFRARLDERIAAAAATGDTFGVMLLDLDRFKEVNDTLGHHFGDEIAARSRAAAGGGGRPWRPRGPARRRRVRSSAG